MGFALKNYDNAARDIIANRDYLRVQLTETNGDVLSNAAYVCKGVCVSVCVCPMCVCVCYGQVIYGYNKCRQMTRTRTRERENCETSVEY